MNDPVYFADIADIADKDAKVLEQWPVRFARNGVMSAKKYLTYAGFPMRIAGDKLHEKPLPILAKQLFKRFMLVQGSVCVGKTTLAANVAYWRGVQLLSREESIDVNYFDTAELVELKKLELKVGFQRATDLTEINGITGEELEGRVRSSLAHNEILILDDFNFEAMDENGASWVSRLVMKRFMKDLPTWIISNESLEALKERFPRIMSRATTDDSWLTVEMDPVAVCHNDELDDL